MFRLGLRLLGGRLRRGRGSSLLVVVVLATAGAAGTSAVVLRSAVSGPWERAFEATYGAHVHVASFGDLDATALAGLPGVAESSGPVVTAVRQLRSTGRTTGVALTEIPEDLRVERPSMVEGSWKRGAVVLERSFARALGVAAGGRVEIDGRTFEVSGIAVSVRTAGYPASVPGRAFADPATAGTLGTGGPRLTTVGLRLARPADEEAVARLASSYGNVTTATAIRAEALDRTRQFQVVLASFSILLLVAGGFLVVVLLGARLRAQSRELVLLRLVGLTPGQLVALVAAEHTLLAGLGGLSGAAAALAGNRQLAEAAATAMGSTAPSVDLSVLGVVGVLVVSAAAVSGLATRRVAGSGLSGLQAGPRARPSSAPARVLAAGMPAPAALVAKEVSASRSRAATTVVAVALAVTTSVAALGMEATFRHERQEAAARALEAPVPEAPVVATEDESGLRTLVYGLQALLALVAVSGIVAVGLVAIRERRRELAVLSAVGFSVRQLAGAAVAGQGVLAGLGALVGIPLGIGFFRLAYTLANGTSAGLVDAPVLHLLAVVPAAMLVAGLVASLPARALRRLPVAAALAPT